MLTTFCCRERCEKKKIFRGFFNEIFTNFFIMSQRFLHRTLDPQRFFNLRLRFSHIFLDKLCYQNEPCMLSFSCAVGFLRFLHEIF